MFSPSTPRRYNLVAICTACRERLTSPAVIEDPGIETFRATSPCCRALLELEAELPPGAVVN